VRRRWSFETWALSLLGVTLLVILWGAYVRVSGSGAGCADHWPLCNGEWVPRPRSVETLIELTHRVTSGLSGVLSIVVFVLARRELSAGSAVRGAATAGLVLMLVEGAIGAMLVKLGLVAQDRSSARALVVGLHLVNTFLLIGAQLLTYLFARGYGLPSFTARPALSALLGVAVTCLLLLGASGAITALGDTLFPAESLAQGLAEDLSPEAHFLVRLRVWHPLLAVLTGAFVVYVAQYLKASLPSRDVARWALWLTVAYVAQLGLGALNLVLLAPAALQIAHLLLADLVWLALVGLVTSALADGAARSEPALSGASA
jgi:cytochrome c oxidase assembly protein subunit 15